MLRRQVRVNTRKRTEPMGRAPFVFGPAQDLIVAVAILRRLLEEQPALDDRSTQLEVRREAFDAVDVEELFVAFAAEARAQIVQPHPPLVPGAPRLNDDESRREPPVLDGVGI